MRYRVTARNVVLALVALSPGFAFADGSIGTNPPPTYTNVNVSADVSYDPSSKWFTYSYTISNGKDSTGSLAELYVNVLQKYESGQWYDQTSANADRDEFTIPVTDNRTVTFDEEFERRTPFNTPPGKFPTPFGMSVPPGWNGAMSRDGHAVFSATRNSGDVPPGQQVSGLELHTGSVPVIKEVILRDFWVPVYEDEPSKADREAASQATPMIRVKTLGPSDTTALGWSAIKDEVEEAVNLGWITDEALRDEIISRINSANQLAVDEEDGTAAKNELAALLNALNSATDQAISSQARALVRQNVEALIRHIPDTPIPVKPSYSLEPEESVHAVGDEVTLTATVVNAANDNKPLPGRPIRFSIFDGPNKDVNREITNTDSEGKATFTYTGSGTGTDRIIIRERLLASVATKSSTLQIRDDLPAGTVGVAEVHWDGGADLAIPHFIPPLIETEGGSRIFVSDWTKNLGNLAAEPSVTRYYLTQDIDTFSRHLAVELGERPVGRLEPGETSVKKGQALLVPEDINSGRYHIVACADAPGDIGETNEENNCSHNRLENSSSITVPVEQPPNVAPKCSNAEPSTDKLLWPPNHKVVPVSIEGVTDPDGDAVTVSVTEIEQDEPVNGRGDGNTAQDGFGIGTDTAKVRAERQGPGDGRIYFISFKAEDELGATCQGSIMVGVPHDKSQKGLPQDSGERYDSTGSG